MATGTISFPGIVAPISLVATRTVGVRPDRAILRCQPQSGSPDCTGSATLQFSFNGVGMSWTNALCDSGTIVLSTHGHIQVIEILDRRWSWSKAYYTKAFNVRNPDGSIVDSSKKSTSAIAAELFGELGVSADVSAVATNDYPELVLDHHRVDDALSDLLTNRGYVISLMGDDSVKVYRRGTGVTLPRNYDTRSENISVNPPQVPYVLKVVGSRTLVQSKLKFLPVGVDVDGTIKQVANLSYAPGSWVGADMENFNFIADKKAKDLAKATVGKWFQVASQADGSLSIQAGGVVNYSPGEISVSSATQYLPLKAELIDSSTNPLGLVNGNRSTVEGTFYQGNQNPPIAANSDDFSKQDKLGYTFNEELGIIKFDELALKKTPGPVDGTFTFADVYMTCSYSVHYSSTLVKDRFERSRNLGGIGTDVMKVNEFERHIVVTYPDGSGTPSGGTDNKSDLNIAADITLDDAVRMYSTSVGVVLKWRGIYNFSTDGNTLQLRWNCATAGDCPWETQASQHMEGLTMLPTGAERGFQRKARMASNPITRRNRNFHKSRKTIGRGE